ncbi:hypothetical protein METBIDRAFT_10772 [Metschnikowia bicuspidata var. bicuspidata NRRL YB-4993]|uniref:P-loop containing nucleoside triphosphate hydrolase protein n=1 Tax=Metschnikowia bicuspidata var. bicuspidata NRRL YB-4993 TaxID=869754 RepID=A0A1A0HD73_9ASCO|nr:hypothetical protein METBIDRAFT_10772 [Metschnikowia bicuspidata var. bicuspidata NRRL YB-4993]OBA21847.1 hypothetical protein METBIDRAFT_10772 [Metschnikowia bicuspidata var. bicuspidata NRRL YB-4993]
MNSICEYQNHLAHVLYLEEKSWLSDDAIHLIKLDDYMFKWEKRHENAFTYEGFRVKIPMSSSFFTKYLKKKLQELGKTSFTKDQAFFLIYGNEVPWYGYVKSIFIQKRSFSGEGATFKVLNMFLSPYSWNKKRQYNQLASKMVTLLPASKATSRSLNAMHNILNNVVESLLLNKNIEFESSQILSGELLNVKLNESQRSAVRYAMANPITIIESPSGTGSTYVIAEMVSQFLRRDVFPILVISESNAKLDQIANLLLPELELTILRVVPGSREAEYSRSETIGPICLHHKSYEAMLPNVQLLLDKLSDRSALVSHKEYTWILKARNPVSENIVKQSRVFLTTSVMAGSSQLRVIPKVPVVIINEVSQCRESLSLIPLSFPGIAKIILIGDKNKLTGKKVTSGLAASLFEKVIANGMYKPHHLLDTQYRMSPGISKFLTKLFCPLLQNGINERGRTIKDCLSRPVVFWDTNSQILPCFSSQAEGNLNLSFFNEGEVGLVRKVLVQLIYEKSIPRAKIGVLSPYNYQLCLIASALAEDPQINPNAEKVTTEYDFDKLNWASSLPILTLSEIVISTIDAFASRNKDYIVISCVDSTEDGIMRNWGDERQCYVAFTRANVGLIIIGNESCLSSGSNIWKKYLELLQTKDSVERNDVLCL